MNPRFDIHTFLATRRDAGVHTAQELTDFCQLAARGEIPDYQVSAWLMAAYLKPLNLQETAYLTVAMADSGERLNLQGLKKPWVDKHSTGGVGDKTTLVLLPLLAACGITILKMSGRGLGITGGTIDKLSAVPGFRTDLSIEELLAQASDLGLALSGQSAHLAPADKALYALRDATETVSSMPLIVSSILSKKLAAGAETVVLDVKAGSGGFMPDWDQARQLASMLKTVGELAGLSIHPVISDMSQPLGEYVGNALEVNEAWDVLTNLPLLPPSQRFKDLCLGLAGVVLQATGIKTDPAAVLASGKAAEVAEAWFKAQGATTFRAPLKLLRETVFTAPRTGYLARLDAGTIGRAVVSLGGGRVQKEDTIDLQVGARIHANVNQYLQQGEPIVTLYSRSEPDPAILNGAIEISDGPVKPAPLFEMSQA